MRNKIVTTDQVKQMDLIRVLEELGHTPSKIVRHDYWYLSPFRTEKTGSFKVNRSKNVWYDFGEGIGGNTLDFIIKYYHCSVKEGLEKLSTGAISNTLKHVPMEKEQDQTDLKMEIAGTKIIQHPALIHYLDNRRIPLNIARQYCIEVDFTINGKPYFAIGFKNDLEGYELRNAYFKGSSSPKSVTHLTNHSSTVCVFEGFFNFLSWVSIHQITSLYAPDFLILNSLVFFQRLKELPQNFERVSLYLDRDEGGKKATQQLLQWSTKFRDESHLYTGYKDLNQWHRHIGKAPSLWRPATP